MKFMAGSSFGNIFRVTTWGESHGYGIGAVVDGVPAGIPITEEYIQSFLDRRKPGTSRFTTPRKEADKVIIGSGVFEGKTTGTPISLMILNTNQRSQDYSQIASYFRPGHADFGFDTKYGFRDYRGGGRSSGRETAARVAAGAIAIAMLNELGINVKAYTRGIGAYKISDEKAEEIRSQIALGNFDIEKQAGTLAIPDEAVEKSAEEYLAGLIKELDSSGGEIECVATSVPAGIGEPVFDKLDARLAQAVMSIGAVKAVEIGDGKLVSEKTGSEDNDGFVYEDGKVVTSSNHAGGILGGMSDGNTIIIRAAVKATPSIAKEQQTVNKDGENITVSIHGRHDPVVVPRAVVVVEAMTALTIADLLLMNMSSKLENVKKVYSNK
jgi:chorismate synthase